MNGQSYKGIGQIMPVVISGYSKSQWRLLFLGYPRSSSFVIGENLSAPRFKNVPQIERELTIPYIKKLNSLSKSDNRSFFFWYIIFETRLSSFVRCEFRVVPSPSSLAPPSLSSAQSARTRRWSAKIINTGCVNGRFACEQWTRIDDRNNSTETLTGLRFLHGKGWWSFRER